jgi:hypothetical protein
MGQRECNTTIKGALYAKWRARVLFGCKHQYLRERTPKAQYMKMRRQQQMRALEFLMRPKLLPPDTQDLIINSVEHTRTRFILFGYTMHAQQWEKFA